MTMIRVFAMKAAGEDFLDRRWDRYLSKDRRALSEKMKNIQSRQLFLGAEVLLNRSLESVLDLDRTALPAKYKRNPYGKPFLLDAAGIYVNWSHSGEYVLCAVADREVGVDLQYIGKEPGESLIHRFLQKTELDYFLAAGREERKKLFYQFWVVKESFLKALGTGFHTSLDTFYVRMEGNCPQIIRDREEKLYSVRLLNFAADGYTAAVCCEGEPEKVTVEYF